MDEESERKSCVNYLAIDTLNRARARTTPGMSVKATAKTLNDELKRLRKDITDECTRLLHEANESFERMN